MNEKSFVIEKLGEESLSSISGGTKFQTFNQAMHVAGLSTMVAGGLSSIGFLTASFICEYKGVDQKKCSLLKKVALSSASVSGLGMLTSVIATPCANEKK